jgi:4-diphosphocytidyl-2-C-methyl-D-erythritol kinase
MMAQVTGSDWPAPAKLNLMLRILGRRPDGFHQLQTVYQFLDCGDLLHFERRRDGQIRRSTAVKGVPEKADLAVRAAGMLKAHTGCRSGVDIEIEKRLPLGGGLGGGSSDAATTLVALNRIWGTGLGQEQLMALALSLGADVPVFVGGVAAWGEGVGEILTPLDLQEPWYLILVPPCGVSTAEVFSDPGLTRNSPAIKISDFLGGDDRNDCEETVRRRYPAVADALDWLGSRARGRLTGTGGCVFAAFAQKEEAVAVRGLAPRHFSPFVARGLNRSPLLDRVAG